MGYALKWPEMYFQLYSNAIFEKFEKCLCILFVCPSVCPSESAHSISGKYCSHVMKFVHDFYIRYGIDSIENDMYVGKGFSTETHKNFHTTWLMGGKILSAFLTYLYRTK